ncbi:MAG TPA: substrate-binding domain-containing protein, partial [Methylomirabilota bacterium]|nr:substrate-binding domain-containing protein [Methylomirabilota bacterium]
AFRKGRHEWRRKRHWLASFLRRAPRPLALFAANDEQALDVLDSCAAVGISVPEEVAVVGAENNLLAPDAMPTPVSSVDTNLELLGYRGAALLDDLMNGAPAPDTPLRIPAAGLVVRKSSDLVAVNHAGVARGLRFILDRGHEPITVQDVARVAAMSPRGLHKAFLEHLGRTPGQELHRVRIERAKRLLAESTHKIATLAGLCGYRSANSFGIAFKQATGLSPRQFREALLD